MTQVRHWSSGRPPRFEFDDWRDSAACAGHPVELFFPLPKRGAPDEAKAVCAHCLVRVDCLAYALRTDQPDGVWGGLSADERRRLSADARRRLSGRQAG